MNVGDKYGRLTVISEPFREGGYTRVQVRCECGTEKVVRVDSLRSGNTTSCGCFNREQITTHGLHDSRIYCVWEHMNHRCTNTSNKNYGGRGITVCEDWQIFEHFYKWSIENGYKDDLSLDRINFNGGYRPDNCRWATRKVQAENHRRRQDNTSGYIGVCAFRQRFLARAQRGGRTVHLGCFDTAIEAAHVRDAYVKEHYESPTLNFK